MAAIYDHDQTIQLQIARDYPAPAPASISWISSCISFMRFITRIASCVRFAALSAIASALSWSERLCNSSAYCAIVSAPLCARAVVR